jgi:hypothetical protein
MATRKPKADGIEALVAKQDPISIQEITMLDWYASFALLGMGPNKSDERMAVDAFDIAEAMLNERARRLS